MKPGKIIIGSHRLKSNILKLAIGLGSLKFSRIIAGKYGIFLRYDSLPALVFRKLSGIKNASNSLKNGPFNNYINLQKFSNFIYPSKTNSKLFKNCIVSACDIRACAKTQAFARFYNPAYISLETNLYHRTIFTTEKNVNKSVNQSKFIIKTSTEKITPEHTGEIKGQLIQLFYKPFLYERETLTSVNKMMFSHLLKELNSDTSISKNAALKDTEKSYFKETGTDAQYKDNLTKQIRDRKKQLISTLNQSPLYAGNLWAVVNSVMLSHLQRKLNFVTSTSVKATVHDMGTLYFKIMENESKYKKKYN